MKKYVEIRIMKRTLIILGIIFITAICGISYYIWCAYHPDVYIQINDGATGKEGIKMEAPHIAFTGHGIAEPAAYVELKLNNIAMQHEFMMQYVRDNYKTSDIKLDMKIKEDQTILKYTGTATTLKDEVVDFEKEVILEFSLDANITKK